MGRDRPQITHKPSTRDIDPEKIGIVIELGSTAIRCVLNDIPDQHAKPVHSIKSRFRLFPAMDSEEPCPDTRDDILFTLKEIRHFLKSHGIPDDHKDIKIVATSAWRDKNSGQTHELAQKLIDKIYEETGFKVDVISGETESRYAAGGAIEWFGEDLSATVGDLGGRSTELAIVRDGEIQEAISLSFGHTNIQDMIDGLETTEKEKAVKKLTKKASKIKDDKLRAETESSIEDRASSLARKNALKATRAFLKEQIDGLPKEVLKAFSKSKRFIPIGGSWRKIGLAFATARDFEITPEEKKCKVLTSEFRKSANDLPIGDMAALKKLGIPERKHDTLLAATLILDVLTKKLGPKHCLISRAAVAEGVLREMGQEKQAHGPNPQMMLPLHRPDAEGASPG